MILSSNTSKNRSKDDIYESHHDGLTPQLVLTKVMSRAMSFFCLGSRLGKCFKKNPVYSNNIFCLMTSRLVNLLPSRVATHTYRNSPSAIFPCVFLVSQHVRIFGNAIFAGIAAFASIAVFAHLFQTLITVNMFRAIYRSAQSYDCAAHS